MPFWGKQAVMVKIKFPLSLHGKEDTNSHQASYIGETLILKGELQGNEDVVIEGKFRGKIDLPNHTLKVEKGGKVEADINVKSIHVTGEVVGNIHASEKVYIADEGHITGDIIAPRISIADGAQFKGNVKMDEDGDNALSTEEILPMYTQDKEKEDSIKTSGKTPD